jgi:hypothetical protein
VRTHLLRQDLIKKHSEFIAYPISLWTEKTTEKEVDDDDEDEAAEAPKEDDDEEGKVEEVRARLFWLICCLFCSTCVPGSGCVEHKALTYDWGSHEGITSVEGMHASGWPPAGLQCHRIRPEEAHAGSACTAW